MRSAPILDILLRAGMFAAVTGTLSACVSLTVDPRALLLSDDGTVKVQSLACAGLDRPPRPEGQALGFGAKRAPALDPSAVRILTWNIHKEDDKGWERDLESFAAQSDIVLLQEVVLRPSLRDIVEAANLRWVMASSFIYFDEDIGVMSAARVAPAATCTQRVVEPLLRIPKSALITWFALAGSNERLAVVNVHAINFSLSLGAYRAQMNALGDALSAHRGPIVFAGDLNTWTEARGEAVREMAQRLDMTEVTFTDDKRRLFFGKQLDHIFIRGFEIVESSAIPVTSSDHNPVRATLRVLASPR